MYAPSIFDDRAMSSFVDSFFGKPLSAMNRMANPMALGYADELVSNDNPSLAYTTVYPLSMFARVVVVQVVVILFCM